MRILKSARSIALASLVLFASATAQTPPATVCDPKTDSNCTQFTGLQVYQAVQQGIASGMTTAQVRAQTGLGPTQFSVVTGQPAAQNTFLDWGLYAQDEWKIRPNVSLSYGLRVETQNEISFNADIAPRIGIAWDPFCKGTTSVRMGYGLYYDQMSFSFYETDSVARNPPFQQVITINPTTLDNPLGGPTSVSNAP